MTIDVTHNILRLLKIAFSRRLYIKWVLIPNYMKHGELRNDLCTITFLTDHVVVTPKYHVKIPVGDNRRGTGIIRKTCEVMDMGDRNCMRGTMNRYVQALYLSPGFGDWTLKLSKN